MESRSAIEYFESRKNQRIAAEIERNLLPTLEQIFVQLLSHSPREYAERPLAKPAKLTLQKITIEIDGQRWLPRLKVYQRRVRRGYQPTNPQDVFLETNIDRGSIAHHRKNGTTVIGLLLSLRGPVGVAGEMSIESSKEALGISGSVRKGAGDLTSLVLGANSVEAAQKIVERSEKLATKKAARKPVKALAASDLQLAAIRLGRLAGKMAGINPGWHKLAAEMQGAVEGWLKSMERLQSIHP